MKQFNNGGGLKSENLVGIYETKSEAEKMKKAFENAYSTKNSEHELSYYIQPSSIKGSILKYDLFEVKGKSKLEKGGVVFTNYNGMEVMYEPNYNEYYVNDMKFDSMEEAKNYIDKGSRMDDKTIDAYRKGAFNEGGAIDGLSDLIYG
jgi:hypothetical protein